MTLRTLALLADVVGAVGSVALLMQAGHPPVFLVVLFSGWVAAPFIALAAADALFRAWPSRARLVLHVTTVVVAAGSLALYGYAVSGMPRVRPVPWFVLLPPLSCVLAALVVSVAAITSRGTDGRRR